MDGSRLCISNAEISLLAIGAANFPRLLSGREGSQDAIAGRPWAGKGYLANACQLGEHVRWCISFATHYQAGAPGLDVENVWRADPIRQYR